MSKGGMSLEVRVGLLILVAVVLLGAFVITIGGFTGEEGKTLYIDFDHPGNVLGGAPVNIGNIRVGRVEEIEYRGGTLDPDTGRSPLIRIRLEIQASYFDSIHEDARVYVTSTSIVGESLIAIDPGSQDRPVVADGHILVGIDPPRMDQAFAMMFELLENIHGLLRDNREELDSLLSAAANMVRSLDGIFTRHGDRIDRIMQNIETATDQTNDLLGNANELITGPRIQRTLRNVDGITSSINRDIDPLLADARSIATKVDDLLDMLGEEQQAQIQSTIRDVSDITHRGTGITEDAEEIVAHIRQGRGTVGAMLMDEEIYDDVQEMLRDLKHNPWKLFWRE